MDTFRYFLITEPDFDENVFYNEFLKEVKKTKSIRFTKNGMVYAADANKLKMMYLEYCQKNLEEVELVNSIY